MKIRNIKFWLLFIAVILPFILSGCGKKDASQWEPQEFDQTERPAGQGVQVLPSEDGSADGGAQTQ